MGGGTAAHGTLTLDSASEAHLPLDTRHVLQHHLFHNDSDILALIPFIPLILNHFRTQAEKRAVDWAFFKDPNLSQIKLGKEQSSFLRKR